MRGGGLYLDDFYCWDLIVFIVGILLLCCIMLCCGYFLGSRSSSYNKNIPFESGIASSGNARVRFSIKFYLIAMIFVIFDVEGVYIYIWSISVREIGWIGLIEISIFIFVLLSSLVYLLRIGVFNWTIRTTN